jgi:hypothetical protein
VAVETVRENAYMIWLHMVCSERVFFWRGGVSGCIGCIGWLFICMGLDTSFATAYIGWIVVINGALSQILLTLLRKNTTKVLQTLQFPI